MCLQEERKEAKERKNNINLISFYPPPYKERKYIYKYIYKRKKGFPLPSYNQLNGKLFPI